MFRLQSESASMNCLRLETEVSFFHTRLEPKNKKEALIKIVLAEALRNFAFYFFRLKPSLWIADLRLKTGAIDKKDEAEAICPLLGANRASAIE